MLHSSLLERLSSSGRPRELERFMERTAMRVRVTKRFRWSPDGNLVVSVEAGETVEGRAAVVALQLNSGEPIAEPQARAIEAAPLNRAKSPPRNKGR